MRYPRGRFFTYPFSTLIVGLEIRLQGALTHPSRVARGLLHVRSVNEKDLIGVRHLKVGERVIPVELYRNACGTVAARCLLGSDVPIIDGPSAEEVVKSVEDALESLLMARDHHRAA